MNLRNNRGFTGVDISIALVIMVLLVGIITSLVYNFGITSKEINRKSEATYLAIQVIEGIKQMKYEEIIEDTNGGTTISSIESLTGQVFEVKNGYTVTVNIENYRDRMGDSTLEDVIKIAKVTVQYTVR